MLSKVTWLAPAFVRAIATGDLGIAITGAGSWLGQALLGMLVAEGALTTATRLRLFGSAARPLQLADRVFSIEPLRDAAPLTGSAWLLLHFAFLGKERTADLTIDAFCAGNAAILADTLRVASGASNLRVVFTSSGAVYAQDRALTTDRTGNPYGWCKATQEAQIAEWCQSRDVPLVMPRIFNIGGPYANKVESYALSSFILSARRTGAIHITARRPTYRSYVHVNELLGVACEAAYTQPAGCPLIFDTAGDRTVEMKELADVVAATLTSRSVVITRDTILGNTSQHAYVGEGASWRAQLASRARTPKPLEAIVIDTIFDLNTRFPSHDRQLMQA